MNSVRISTAILSLSLLLCGGLGCSPVANSGKPGEGGKMRMASLQNKAGKFIEPSIESGQKALAAAALPDDLIGWASDPEGEGSYPIVTYTWIIAYKKYADPKRGNALKNVLSWCLTDGQKESPALGYIPLPTAVADKVKAALATIAVEGGDKNEAKGPVSLQGAGKLPSAFVSQVVCFLQCGPPRGAGRLSVGGQPGRCQSGHRQHGRLRRQRRGDDT